MKLKNQPDRERQKLLRMPPANLASEFEAAYETMTDSVFGDNFLERWDRCFSVRQDVAQHYAGLIEATHYQRQKLNHMTIALFNLLRYGEKLPDYRPVFEECVVAIKETIDLLSDCEPAAVLPEESAQLKRAVYEAEIAFAPLESALAKLEPVHLDLQRHFELLFTSTGPAMPPRRVSYESKAAEVKLDRDYEKARETHLSAAVTLANIRDELFAQVTYLGLQRYLEEADRLDTWECPRVYRRSPRVAHDQTNLDKLRDRLEVAAVMLPMSGEGTS